MANKELMKRYYDFINWYDPYYAGDDETPADTDGALYNLIQIYRELSKDRADDRELIKCKIRLGDLLLSFRAAGFKVVV